MKQDLSLKVRSYMLIKVAEKAKFAEILQEMLQMAYARHVLRGNSGINAVLILEVKISKVRP